MPTVLAIAVFLLGVPWLLREELGWLVFPVEAVAGFLTNSLALLSDAGHMLTDVIGIGMALAAAVYEHAAYLIGRTPWEVSRNEGLTYEAHAEAYRRYRHSPHEQSVWVHAAHECPSSDGCRRAEGRNRSDRHKPAYPGRSR